MPRLLRWALVVGGVASPHAARMCVPTFCLDLHVLMRGFVFVGLLPTGSRVAFGGRF